ncbi:Hypothetical protein NocV09_00800010 [Nannochloropsis oceanica]
MRALISKLALLWTLAHPGPASSIDRSGPKDEGYAVGQAVAEAFKSSGYNISFNKIDTADEQQMPFQKEAEQRQNAQDNGNHEHDSRTKGGIRRQLGITPFGLRPSTIADKKEAYKKFAAKQNLGRASSLQMAGKWSSNNDETLDLKAVTDGKLMQPNCAWQAFITGGNHANINAAYPDSHCVYQLLVMTKVTEDRIFRVKAKFPTGGNRYFSLQSNNPNVGFPLATIPDFKIKPDPGVNAKGKPWKNPYMAGEEVPDDEVGSYTIYVTPRGDKGYPNEINLCTKEMSAIECGTTNAIVVMRFYTSNPDMGMLNSETDTGDSNEPRLFGYAGMPVVEVRTCKNGCIGMAEKWKPFRPCDQSRPTPLTKMIEDNFAKVIPGWGTPSYPDVNDNFIMYMGLDSSSNGVYPNLDANYLVANTWQEAVKGAPGGNPMLVARITGKLPLTAWNFHHDPKTHDYENYEVRYNSFSTIAKLQTAPTIQSVDDSEIRRFYRGKITDWETTRPYSIVVGPSKGTTCGLYNASNDLFLTTTMADGSIADNWAVLDRQLVPRYTRDGQPDKSITYTRITCSAMSDERACHNPSVLKQVLGEYYPSITWYTCGDDGQLRPAFPQTMLEKYFGKREAGNAEGG